VVRVNATAGMADRRVATDEKFLLQQRPHPRRGFFSVGGSTKIGSTTLLTSGSLQQNIFNAAIYKWRKRLAACVCADGQHFEYFLKAKKESWANKM